MTWWVYILECKNGTLYTGISTDPARRLIDHLKKKAKYTSYNPPKAIVYKKRCKDRSAAAKREYAIKSLTRRNKLELIRSSDRIAVL